MPKQNPLAYGRGVWLRQYSDTGEKTTPAIIATLQSYASSNVLALKVADGKSYVGQYDPLTPVTSIASLLALKAVYAASGITLVPVVVPHGVGDAPFHGAIAQALGSLIVDIEYDPQNLSSFWSEDPATIPQYWATLRQAAGEDAFLISQPDPRALADVATEASLPSIDGFAAQHYVGWTEVGWTDLAAEVARYQTLAAYGKPCMPTIWGTRPVPQSALDPTPDLAKQFWTTVCEKFGALGVLAFALGPMNAQQLQAYAWFALPTPPPAPDPAQLQKEIDTLSKQLAQETALVSALQTKIANAQAALQ